MKPKTEQRMSIEERLDGYIAERWFSLKKSIALRKAAPGCLVWFRRVAKAGPGSESVLVFEYDPFLRRKSGRTISYDDLSRMAAKVTDDEVMDYLDALASGGESDSD